MFKSRFLFAVLAAVIIIGLLVVGGLAIYRVGWAQGYMSAQEAGVGADSAIPPSAFLHPGWRFGHTPFAMGGRVFLMVGVLFLIFLVIKSFCFRLSDTERTDGHALGRVQTLVSRTHEALVHEALVLGLGEAARGKV